MNLQILPAFSYKEDIGALFAEYTQMLIDGDPKFAEYLSIQNYDEELRHLEYKYGEPYGRLYIALLDGEAVGCIGLRKIDRENCEMKRLYVRPAARGAGLGGKLARLILADAAAIGYKHILLDTLPFLPEALGLYKKLGFYEIPCYNDSPMDTSIYLQYDL